MRESLIEIHRVAGRHRSFSGKVVRIYKTDRHVIIKDPERRRIVGGYPDGIRTHDFVEVNGYFENEGNPIQPNRLADYELTPDEASSYFYVEMMPGVTQYLRGSEVFDDSRGWSVHPWYRISQGTTSKYRASLCEIDFRVYFGLFSKKQDESMTVGEFLTTFKRWWPGTPSVGAHGF